MQVEQPASRDRARQGVRWLEVEVAGWQRARRCGSRLVDIAVFAAVRSWLAGGVGALDLFCARPLPLGFGLFCKAWKPAGFVARWVRDAAVGGKPSIKVCGKRSSLVSWHGPLVWLQTKGCARAAGLLASAALLSGDREGSGVVWVGAS
jgi:hypothetical protein